MWDGHYDGRWVRYGWEIVHVGAGLVLGMLAVADSITDDIL